MHKVVQMNREGQFNCIRLHKVNRSAYIGSVPRPIVPAQLISALCNRNMDTSTRVNNTHYLVLMI